jgi:hypothetical protein
MDFGFYLQRAASRQLHFREWMLTVCEQFVGGRAFSVQLAFGPLLGTPIPATDNANGRDIGFLVKIRIISGRI